MSEAPRPDGHDRCDCDDGSCGILHDRARRRPLSADELRKIVPAPDDSWKRLPEAERGAYVRREVAEGRWTTLLKRPLDDDLLDVIGCVRTMMREADSDWAEELACLISNGRTGPMLVVALKLLAELASEQGLSPDWMGVWGSYAVQRST